MRTEQQIKRKMNELTLQKNTLTSQLSEAAAGEKDRLESRIAQIEDMILLLEWVLNEPTGKYHV